MAIDFTPDAEPVQSNSIQFTPDDAPPAANAPANPTTSKLESFGRGFAQSATLGFGKWVNGLLDANNNIPSPQLSQSDLEEMRKTDPEGAAVVESQMYPQQSGPKTGQGFWADVIASVEQQKKDNDTAFSDHPGYYVGGATAPVAVGGLVKGAGTLVSKIPGLAGVDTLGGIGAGYVAPSTVKGIAAASAATGAVQGATDSTTGKQLLTNVPTSAVTSGLLSLVPSGVLAGLDKIGVKGALSRLSSIVDDAMAKNPLTSQPAVQKLRELVSGAPEHADMKPKDVQDLVDGMSKKDLIDHARGWSDILHDPEKHATFDPTGETSDFTSAKQSRIDATGHVVKQLAPGFGTVAGDIALAAPGAGAMGYGAHLGGTPGAIIGGIGALTEIPTLPKLGKDAGNYLGMRYAGSQGAQNFLGTSTVLGSSGAGNFASDNDSVGLSGILGDYIVNHGPSTWLK